MKPFRSFIIFTLFLTALSFNAVWAEEISQSKEQAEFDVFDLGEIYVTAEQLPASRDITVMTEITAEEIKATNYKEEGRKKSN
jgi:hypothetical protein